HSENAGTYVDVITCSPSSLLATNYTFATGNLGDLVINTKLLTVTADSTNRPYGDGNPSFTATITGFANGETLATSGVTGSPSLTTTATDTTNAGTATIVAALGSLAANNYDFAFVNGTL